MQKTLRPLNVFIADDSILIRNKLRNLFSVLPVVTICGEADHADHAIEAIKESEADVVILDIDLKESSGLKVLKAIKGMTPSPLVIMLTIHAYDDMGDYYLQTGADYYFEKGGAFDDILNLLESEGEKDTRLRDWRPPATLSENKNILLETPARASVNTGLSPSDDEKSLRQMLEASPDCIGIVNAEGLIIWMNTNGRQLMKLSLPELNLGVSWLDLWTEDDHFSAHNAITAAKARQPNRFTAHRRTNDNCDQWWDVSLTPLPNPNSQEENSLFIARDSSERRAAETVLLQTEARYRSLFESSIHGIFQTAADGTVLVANPALAAMLGYSSPDELLINWPHFPRECFAQPTQRVDFFDRILSGDGVVRGFEYELKRNQEPNIWVSISARACRDETGAFCGYKANIEDISDRRKATRLIREQADFINRAHNAITVTDLAGRITFWNQGAERIFGYKASEALGKIPTEILPNEESTKLLRITRQVMKTGEWRGAISVPNKEGKEIHVDAHISLICDERNTPTARLCIASDVTEKKQLEEHVIQGQRLEGIGMIAAGIAHDLNNVLAPILIAVPMLKEQVESPMHRQLLGTMGKSAERGAGLVRQILSFANQSETKSGPLNLPPLINDLSSVIRETFPKSINYISDINSDLWMIKGNAVQLHQVLLNLCVNARDAMDNEGTIKLSVENRSLGEKEASKIQGAVAGSYVCFSIADNGPGISPEIINQIWDPFFSTKGPEKGTGLGLSTVRGIVERHRGFVVLKSIVNEGSVFEVWLPSLNQLPLDQDLSLSQTSPDGSDLILIVDDEPSIRNFAHTALTKQGYRVQTACDGAEAIDFFTRKSQSVSLVITDLRMPNLDGKALVQSIHKLAPQTKFITMSGSVPEAENAQFNQANEVVFLKKPFLVKTLLRKVAEVLDTPASNS